MGLYTGGLIYGSTFVLRNWWAYIRGGGGAYIRGGLIFGVLLPIFFHNRGLNLIKLNKILRHKDIISKLPEKLQIEELPSILYSLSPTIRNKLFNYKETVNNIDINDQITYGTQLPTCECFKSSFVDKDHGHIITGDLRIIENEHLQKLISIGSNYREPKGLNWKKCREVVVNGLEEYTNNISSKFDLDPCSITPWKNAVLEKVDLNIIPLNVKPNTKK